MTMDIKKKPLVSIIMPAYNSASYIKDAIVSVQKQSVDDWELIIIDDASSDGTFTIIEHMMAYDERINIHRNDINLGVSKTRNKGVRIARSQWIAFLDSDDLWEDTKLEKQLTIAIKEKVDFLFTGSSFINSEGVPYSGVVEVPGIVTYSELMKDNIIPCSSVLIRKEIIETVPMEKDYCHEDYLTWLKILRTGIYAYGINEPLLIYRISATSKSGNKFKSIRMTYNVYRAIGLDIVTASYYLARSVSEKIKKRNQIKMRK